MYTKLPAFVLGFHGCDESVVDKVVSGEDTLTGSQNDYDWLGHGIYFWENDPERALKYAEMLKAQPGRGRGRITRPAVLGAVIDLGHCLNLMKAEALGLVGETYGSLRDMAGRAGTDLPVNTPGSGGGSDLLLRRLDCAVIQLLHEENSGRGFDTVRGLFLEGEPLYPNAGFRARNHIQVCVRNSNCIKGYFIPRQPDKHHPIP